MGRFSFQWGNNTPTVEQDNKGNWFYSFLDSFNKTKGFKSDAHKLEVVLNNPAALKVLSFIADVGSQVQFNKVQGETIQQDYLTSIAKTPNDWQGWSDLHWDINFWRAMGAAYVYEDRNTIYTLIPSRIEFTRKQINDFGQLTFSKFGSNAKRNVKKGTFKYNNENGSTQKLELSKLHILSDLSNSIKGNWLLAPSRIDALYKVLRNSDLALESKSINLEFSQKFLVGGTVRPENLGKVGLDKREQQSIENIMRGRKNLVATKDPVSVEHLVSNLAQLKLDDSYISDLTMVANMFGITKDVLAIIAKGSTYENYEKAMALYISYTQTPNDTQLAQTYERMFEVEGLEPSYSHLSFNSVIESDKIANQKIELESLKIAMDLGMSDADIQNRLKQIYG